MFYTSPAVHTLLQDLYDPTYQHENLPDILHKDYLFPNPLLPRTLYQHSAIALSKTAADPSSPQNYLHSLFDPRHIVKRCHLETHLLPGPLLFQAKYMMARGLIINHLRTHNYDYLHPNTLYSAYYQQTFSYPLEPYKDPFHKTDQSLLTATTQSFVAHSPSLLTIIPQRNHTHFRDYCYDNCFCSYLDDPDLDKSELFWDLVQDEDSITVIHWMSLLQLALNIHPHLDLALGDDDDEIHFPYWHTWLLHTLRSPFWPLNFTY